MPTPRPNLRRIHVVDSPATSTIEAEAALRWADRLAYTVIAVSLAVLAWLVWR